MCVKELKDTVLFYSKISKRKRFRFWVANGRNASDCNFESAKAFEEIRKIIPAMR
jgi:hypothetical protein